MKVEIKIDTRIPTDIKILNIKPDIVAFDKVKKEITIIEIGITSQDNLMTVETEKTRKYDLLANELRNIYKCKTRIIRYVMTWDGLVTKYHKKYICSLGISVSTKAYIQSRILKKTLKSISFDYRRGCQGGGSGIEDMEKILRRLDSEVYLRHAPLRSN